MSHYKLPPNYYLQFYPPPPHPPPPPTLHTTPQKFLRFNEFRYTRFTQNRNFFQHALNPTIPWWLWRVEGEEDIGEEARSYQQQAEGYENHEYQEEYYEEVEERIEEPKVQFVLSEEAIAMFRFSELRRQELAKEDTLPQSTNNDLLATEPDPSFIPSFHGQPSIESKEFYGDSCTIINTLEAAVNSTFVQSFTNNNNNQDEVVYWPVLPLRFV